MAYTTIDDPTAYFQVKTYTGNGSTNAITFDGNTNMQPDFVWIKDRDTSQHHRLADVVRGVKKNLKADQADAENTPDSNNGLQSFDSNGFTLTQDSSDHGYNASGSSQVSWNWLAGGSASSNTDGDTNTSVSANTTSGFSIVKWTGDGGATTLGHGLGAVPKWILVKTLDRGENWVVYHVGNDASAPEDKSIRLDGTNAVQDNSTHFNDTAPTSSVFSVGASNGVNPNGEDQIAYCFAEKKGYSKFGTYKGNSNADGPFVYTGFKPSFIIGKVSSDTNDWFMFDNKRSTFNAVDDSLFPNKSDAESTSHVIDFLSNGFKIRDSDGTVNSTGNTYIYMAFAESPFVSSKGIPTTAR